jgi:hypothetical protein
VRLEGEAWSRYFRDFTSSAFRLERWQVYTMPDEKEDLSAFAKGEFPPPGYHYGWLDTVSDAVKAGKTFRRVRIVTRPLSFYTKWEFVWGYDWNVKAGEDIRILDGTDGPGLELPDHDFWLFDETTVVELLYREDGTQAGRELVERPDLSKYLSWRDAAWEAAVPYIDYHQD